MKRYLGALLGAIVVTVVLTWVGARIARVTSGPETAVNDFTVGQRYVLCGHAIEARMAMAGYDLDQWTGERCRHLSKLDQCLLACLERAGTVEIAEGCYERCVKHHERGDAGPDGR
jgi:hypothetical protein